MTTTRGARRAAIGAFVGVALFAGFSTGGTPRMAPASVSVSGASAIALAFDADDLSPGRGGTAIVALDTGSPSSGPLAIHAVDVVDGETACSANERGVDATCGGTGSGELSADVELSMWLPGADRPVWRGTVDDLRAGATLADVPSGRWDLRVDYLLPAASGNDTETDRLELTLNFDAPDTAVLGAEIQSDPLARTGMDVVRLVSWGVALLGLAAAVVLLSRRVDKSGQPPSGTPVGRARRVA